MPIQPERGSDDDRSERVRKLFAAALDLTTGERAAYLRSACAGDADLHELVADLLRHHDDAPTFLLEPQQVLASLSTELPRTIGPYRIFDLLGQGGMGVVYRAEQERPRRIVALKVLSSSMLLAEARQRFAKEAELLSRLSHPGIAQVFDAGVYASEHGDIACFAMELVPGRNLTTFVRELQLDVTARLHLLIRICEAVQHAHGRGVVHRDLKPANILIDESTDGQCQPKVLDFGIARSTDLDHAATQLTRTGQVLGTLDYMSPEQVRGDATAIGVRSDVYSLGVILYELLADRRPLQIDGLPFADALHRICDEEPTHLRHVDTRLRGDLDTIAQCALAKDPDRRYPSVAAFAEDLRRHLDHRPILASPPSWAYRLRKFSRRHRALVFGGLATFLALSAGLVATAVVAAENLHLMESEQRQRRAAEAGRELLRSNLYRDQMGLAAAALGDAGGMYRARALCAEWVPAPGAVDYRCFEWFLFTATIADAAKPIPLTERVTGIEWHPTRPRVAVGTYQRVRVFDLPEGTEPYQVSAAPRRRVRWSRDGNLLLSGWLAGFDVLDGNDGKRLAHVPVDDGREIPVNEQTTGAFAWHPDGQHVFVGSFRGDLLVYDWRTGRRVLRAEGVFEGGGDLDCDATGTRLLLANKVLSWPGLEALPLQGTRRYATPTFSPDGRFAAAAGKDLVLWDASTGAERAVEATPTTGWRGLCFSPDGSKLAAANEDRTVRIWDPRRPGFDRLLLGHTGAVHHVGWSTDGRWVASGSRNYELCVWDLTNRPAQRRLLAPANQRPETRLRWHANGTELLTADALGARRANLTGTGAELLEAGALGFATWNADGSQLAFVRDDRLFVRSGTGERAIALPEPPQPIRGLAWRPGTGQLAVSWWGTVLLVDTGTSTVRTVWQRTKGEIDAIRWQADGRHLVVAQPLYDLVHLDADSGTVLATGTVGGLFGHTDHRLSRDGRLLAVACQDGNVEIRAMPDLTLQHRLFAGDQPVRSVAFHPTEPRLAAAGDDGCCRLWDPLAGEEIASLRFPGPIVAVDWRADGRALAVLLANGIVEVRDATRGYEAAVR